MKEPQKHPVFRSPEEWKATILTLPDTAYFELLRSVFGNIKTPFNKHRLMEELGTFLSRREIQDALAAYIGLEEHRIIAAIALLGEPVPGDLESFFSGEYSLVELHGMLLNLEERFIVYRFRDESAYRLALNPLLEPVLAPFAADTSALFPSTPAEGSPVMNTARKTVGGDSRIFAALLSFLAGEHEFYKAEGGIRKKVLEDGQRIFPDLSLETLSGGLFRLGLLRGDGTGVSLDDRKLRSFAGLSAQARLEYWAAGLYLYLLEGSTDYIPRGRMQAQARFIRRFTGVLETGRSYPRISLRRIACFLGREETSYSWGIMAGPVSPVFSLAGFDVLLEALEIAGILAAPSPGRWIPALLHAKQEERPEEKRRPVIAMDTAFSCILYPEIDFADALLLASFCAVQETGAVTRFELNRESVVRGFDRDMNAEAMISCLERLSGGPVDQSLHWTLEDWGSRYASVSLYHGLVLSLAEDRRYLAGTEPLASHIARTLAPGVYLLADADKSAITEILGKAGVDIIAQPPLPPSDSKGYFYTSYPSLETIPRALINGGPDPTRKTTEPTAAPETEPGVSGQDRAKAYQDRFRQTLEKLSLPKAEQDELAARIDRRLILTESQLSVGAVRVEKLEARNLDYVGKTLVAKQAISSKSMVEVVRAQPGGESHIFGIPEALEKQGGETILILKPLPSEEGAERIRLPLGKISLLRRIKKSIFGE